jgi:NADPH2:quinone reductase
VAVGQRVAGLTSFGGYAGKAICHQDGVVALPDGMDCVKAAAVPVNGATAWLALHGLIRVRAQDRVFIRSAAGGVGLMAAQMALGAGCEVFGAVGTDAKVEFLKGLGVHHPMNHQAADIEGEVRTVTGGCGLDLVLDSAGGDAIASGLRMLGAGGRLVSIGVSSIMPRTDGPQTSAGPTLQRATVLHPYTLLAEGKGLVGINLMRLSEQRPALVGQALRAAFDLVFTGRVRVHVDSVHPFEAATQAHLRLQGGRSIGKVVIGFGG